uniref:Uncharacterized protein n=1 Tax=Tanacetum cinerariifolium TaxID=118510 RepID=A0A6L2N1Y6_TANCI|nr:hypothetical protein [Tanacetum cinerariifolium]
MNQESYNSDSLSFDQPQPLQSPVIHQPPQELSIQEMEDLKQHYLDELKHLSNLEYHDEVKIVELTENFNGMSIEIRKKEKLLQQEQWAYLSTYPSKRLTSFCFDDDDDDEDYTSAITPNEPVLSTEEPDNSLSMGDEHLDTIPATESDEFLKFGVENLIPIPNQIEDFSKSNEEFSSIADDSFSIDNIDYVEASPPDSELISSEVMEIVIPEVGGIDDDILLMIKGNFLREKLLNVNLLIDKIEALNANPTPSSDCKTKSPSTSLNSLLEETNTFDNSLPEFETFCFDVEEISSGSTTTHLDISLLEYKAFHDDHVKEISSGSPTTHSDSSLYASFIFDLSINPFPPADRSDSYEFTDELIPFISAPKYDCFLFKVEPNSRDFTTDVVEDISPTKEPQVLNTLPTHPTLQLNMKFQPSSESLFAYVVWIFLPFLVYSVVHHYLLSLRNEDAIFDPGICKSTFSRKLEEKQTEEERAAKAKYWKLPVCYDDDDDEEISDSLDDDIISGLPSFSAITPDEPILSIEEPDNSLSMGDEHLDTSPATEIDEFIKSCVENLIPIPSESKGILEHMCDVPSHDNSPPLDVSKDQIEDFSDSEVMEFVIPEVGGIDDDIFLTIKDDILREKLLNVNLLIAKIEALNANPTPSSDCKTKSSSTSLNSLLEKTNTFDNSLPEFETFCFDVEKISSGSTTTHSDSSLYASFIFDLSINPFPPADRSDSFEFTDELIPFISPPEYDCFLFKVEPNSRDFTKDVVEDISPTKEPQVLNTLPTQPTLQLNMKFQPSSKSLFSYVVWIFLPFLVYSVAPHYLLSLRTEDTIFDPGICNSNLSRPDISHRCGTVKIFNTHRSHLNKCPMLIHGQNNPPLDVLLFHFIPLDSLKYGRNLVQLI